MHAGTGPLEHGADGVGAAAQVSDAGPPGLSCEQGDSLAGEQFGAPPRDEDPGVEVDEEVGEFDPTEKVLQGLAGDAAAY